MVLDPDKADVDVRSAIFALAARADLQGAADVVGQLLSGGDQVLQRLLACYPHVRRFLPALLQNVRFAAVPTAHAVLPALSHLRALEEGQAGFGDAPKAVISEAWRPLAVVDGHIDRRGYTFCVLDRLRLGASLATPHAGPHLMAPGTSLPAGHPAVAACVLSVNILTATESGSSRVRWAK